ncbi:MAG: MFS transporter [Sphingobacteriia bacterium]|nr:MAG: MFS transporter [Sphingobacteriia bacterium]
MCSLPLSGWLVAHWGSQKTLWLSSALYPLVLLLLGLCPSVAWLALGLFGFGLVGNMVNIAVNTQAVGVEQQYGRSIMASFHGVWSLAGFCGAAVATGLVLLGFSPQAHFQWICVALWGLAFFIRPYTLPTDQTGLPAPLFAKPDKALFLLGLMAFACMACEGTMFDWSGIYFQRVVKVPAAQISMGYTAFMVTMATGRFVGDKLVTKFGPKKILQGSGLTIFMGLALAVFFPQVTSATLGFFVVGFGVSSVVPLVYSAAGRSQKMNAGVALAAVSSIGFLGFLLGPPLIGFVAAAWGLQTSFFVMAILGLSLAYLAHLAFPHPSSTPTQTNDANP